MSETTPKYIRLTRNVVSEMVDECNRLYFNNTVERPLKIETWTPHKRTVGMVRPIWSANRNKVCSVLCISRRYRWTADNLRKVVVHEISTISRWLSGNTKVINNKSLQSLVNGESINGIDAAKAMKLYLALQALGFSKSSLNKRYMIDVINDLKKSGEEEKTFLKLSKITSISQIEKTNYADGDVIAQIKSIINADYDTWRIENVIGVEEEIEAAKKNPLLETVSREDIETYLSTSSKVKEGVKPFNKAA